jgi:phosphoglycerate kinase
MGLFEEEEYCVGTATIAETIANNVDAHNIVGGGETIQLVDQFDLHDTFDFISTGGGAMLEYLAGKKLPGIEALK